jgi:hypothetical protein
MSTLPVSVDEVVARLDEIAGDVEQLQAALAATVEAGAADQPTGPAGRQPEPLYPSTEVWTTGFFAQVYIRPVGGDLRWCRRWFEHAEAVIRLELLWRSWEAYRLRPLGAVDWHDILDRQLPVLLSDRGPFAACTPDRHEPTRPLRVEPAPAGWWDEPEPARPAQTTLSDAPPAAEAP